MKRALIFPVVAVALAIPALAKSPIPTTFFNVAAGGGADNCGGVSANLVFHLDASNSAKISCSGACSNGNAVSSWTDQVSGNVLNASGTGPTYNSAGLNSKATVSFDGSTMGLAFTSNLDLSAGGAYNTSYTILFVGRPTASGSTEVDFLSTSGSGDVFGFDNGSQAVTNWGSSNNGAFGPALSRANYKLFGFEWSSAQSNTLAVVTGVLQDTATNHSYNVPTTSWNAINRMGVNGLGQHFKMDVAEVCIFQPALASGSRSTVYGALNTKWGGSL